MAPLTEKSGNARKASSLELEKAAKQLTETAQNIGRKRKSDADEVNDTTSNKKAKKQATQVDKTTSGAKAKASSSSSTGSKSSTSTKKAAPSKKQQQADELAQYDISQIHLDGEENNMVPVYDTCNDIRTKITAYQRKAPTKLSSSAAMIRAFTTCIYSDDKPEGLSATGLKTFMKQKGHNGGASSPIFYTAYVYFEKLRVKQNKQKTKRREEMEQAWGKEGMDISADSSKRMFLHASERVVCDKYGHMDIVGPQM